MLQIKSISVKEQILKQVVGKHGPSLIKKEKKKQSSPNSICPGQELNSITK